MYKVLKRKKRVNGEVTESKNYYLRYKLDSMPRDKFISLRISDKSTADVEGAKLYAHFQKVEAGLELPREVVESQKLPLSVHVKNFCDELTAKRRSPEYIDTCQRMLLRLFKEMQVSTIYSISAERFEAWRKDHTYLASKTLNDYRAFLLQFMQWHLKHKRVPENPITLVEKVKKDTVSTRARRALTVEEIKRLVTAKENRGIIYLTAVSTGLRRKELRELEWRDIDFSARVIRARASTTKNSKDGNLPMPEALYDALQAYREEQEDVKASDRVFETIPSMTVFRSDLKVSGIVEVDEHGKRVDFHALRHTYCTLLSSSGVSMRTAQSLMRHSDPRLTSQVYTDENLLPLKEAIEKLPNLSEESSNERKERSVVKSAQKGAHIGAHIGAQISDITSQNVARFGESKTSLSLNMSSCNPLIISSKGVMSRDVSQDDGVGRDGRPTRTRT